MLLKKPFVLTQKRGCERVFINMNNEKFFRILMVVIILVRTGVAQAQQPVLPSASQGNASKAIDDNSDFTKHNVTDPLLEIINNNRTGLFPPGDPFYTHAQPAKPDFDRNPPVINHLWGKNGVLVVEPAAKEAEVDFSAITIHRSGKLRLQIHRHPGGAVEVQLLKGEKMVETKVLNMHSNNWEIMAVSFDKESVRLKLSNHGWIWPTAFLDYSFATQ